MKNYIFLILILTLAGCSNESSLQKYFVEKTESADFIAVDISPDILNADATQLSDEQKKALKTFKKMNILAFKRNETNQEKFKTENAKLKEILKNEKYQELMKFGSGKSGAAVYFTGNEDAIEEFILYGTQSETGFAVVRVLGDKMNPENFMVLLSALQKSDINQEHLKPLEGLFK